MEGQCYVPSSSSCSSELVSNNWCIIAIGLYLYMYILMADFIFYKSNAMFADLPIKYRFLYSETQSVRSSYAVKL